MSDNNENSMLSQILATPDSDKGNEEETLADKEKTVEETTKTEESDKTEESGQGTSEDGNNDDKNKTPKKEVKSSLKGQDFARIFGAIFIVSGIFFGAFLAYIVFNPGQAQFFISLGIKPQDIKALLEKLVNFSFGFITFAISIVWIMFLFKAILTKKEFKKKKTISIILSIIIGITLFSGITLWAFLIQKIGATNYINPNGGIIIYDNDKLLSDKFKDSSILSAYNNLIGPFTLRFDFKSDVDYYGKYLDIESYEIDFNGDNKIDKTGVNPANEDSIIYNYDKKGVYKPKGIYKGIDLVTGKEKEISMNFPDINIIGIVKIEEKPQRLGGKKVIFDASDLREIGKISWFLEDNNTNTPDYEGYKYSPKIFTKESLVCMNLYNNMKQTNSCDKIYVIKTSDEGGKNDGTITYEQDIINPLTLKFSVDMKDKDKISSYKWLIDDTNIITDQESPEYPFLNYGKHNVKLTMTDYIGNTSDLQLDITIRKPLVLVKADVNVDPLGINNSLLRIEDEKGVSLVDKTYKKELRAYYIKSDIPKKLNFNVNYVKVTDNTYELTNAEWDFDGDGKYEKIGKNVSYEFLENKKYTIKVEYTFESKLKNSIQKITENIIIEGTKKEFDLNLKVVQEAEYAPTVVHIDGSASQVSEGSIVKYSYDFGEGKSPIEGDAKIDYKYNFPGEYIIKLTVTKNNGKKESITKKVILKGASKDLIINSSVSYTYVGKSVDFDTIGSLGQIESYSWNFGDGQSSSDANPTHTYEAVGTYRLKLTVTYSDGTIKTGDKVIDVKEDNGSL
ncbi:MAG: PKD domain-containing protein [Candidatus Gracilibacteria bacterium]|nr:PKD domain-containing protein [Candidatus Gracilibacteria bacterium]